jgi:hypothetical protein
MDPITQLPLTSSLPPEVTANLHNATGMDRVVTILYKKIEELDKEVHDLKTKKIIDETQMPREVLEQAGMFPPGVKTLRRGRGYRPLLRSEIEDAIKVSPFCTDQAKYLGVAVSTLRRYAKPLGLWKPQPHCKGCKKAWGPEKGMYPLSKILNGDFNDSDLLDDWRVKNKLFKAKTFPEECAVCGYNKKHIVNGRVPLLLDHMDGNVRNFKKDNLRLLCWNCTVECGRGYLRRGVHFFDPDWNLTPRDTGLADD